MGIDDACGNVSCPHIDPAKALSRHDRVNHIDDAYGIVNNIVCGITLHHNPRTQLKLTALSRVPMLFNQADLSGEGGIPTPW